SRPVAAIAAAGMTAPGVAKAPASAAFDAITGRDMARIYIGAGRNAGIRPQDLVGAIANEAGVAGALIGAIQIADRYSIVEVPEEVAQQVIKALGKATVRGKKVQVRPDASGEGRHVKKVVKRARR
ncbi:MAG TPA: DbpA RNA binding domain-containing protein, partial [Usitatibacter sp.]|nr:DbpA RNA binding domain-containing protein [Usitatibacter sp.]